MKYTCFRFCNSLYIIAALFLMCCSTSNNASSSGNSKIKSSNNVKVIVEKLATIIGGNEALQKKLVYPDKAREEQVETVLKAHVLVTEIGKIEKITFDTKTGHGFEDAARNALYQVEFEPGSRNGEPVSMFITVLIKFEL